MQPAIVASLKLALAQTAQPSHCFKAILIEQADGTQNGFGFVMPNESGYIGSMWDFKTTVDDVETQTGFDFFATLSDELEERIESETVWF